MGSTSYRGMTAGEAKDRELTGCDILAKSGNWYVYRSRHGEHPEKNPVGLTYFIVRRFGDGVNVKAVDITGGPYSIPPASIVRTYLAYYDGDIDKAGGPYGAPILRKALEPRLTLTHGDVVTVAAEDAYGTPWGNWTDGPPVAGTYTFIRGYRFRRSDGIAVRFPKDWKSRWTYTKGN